MKSSFRRRKTGPITSGTVKDIDYKNLDVLKDYVYESGRMNPSRNTGASAKSQRQLCKAIKLARYLVLMPYCDWHE